MEPREKFLAAGSVDQTGEFQRECDDRPGQRQGLHSVPQGLDETFAASRITQGRDLLPGLAILQGGVQPSLANVTIPQCGVIECAEHEPRDSDEHCFSAGSWRGQGERFAYGFRLQSGTYRLAIIPPR